VPGGAARRLPGVRFEAWAPALPDVLPRMDVAGFVGFAASGPLHQPVVVEDVGHLEDLFGPEATLAWDAERGALVRAHLAPAVRAFFRNGGARCVVVRVAGAARSNRFPVPGVLVRAGAALRPAFARARSEGSWSDPLRVGATLGAQPFQLAGWTVDGGSLVVVPPAGAALSPGDLLRVTFPAAGLQVVVPVHAPGPPPPGADPRAVTVPLVTAGALWFDVGLPASPASPFSAARWFTAGGAEVVLPVATAGPADGEAGPDSALVALAVQVDAAPPPGTLLRLEGGPAEAWLKVESVDRAPGVASAAAATVAQGPALVVRAAPASPPAAAGARCERLELDLWVRTGSAAPARLSGLGFVPEHPRAWEALPADQDLFDDQGQPLPPEPDDPQADLRDEVRTPRFALAGPAVDPAGELAFSFPVGAAFLAQDDLGCDASADDALVRDGLVPFGPEPFLDPDLVEPLTDTLLAEADFLRHQSPTPRRLRGVHALLPCDEVTIVAVPDAIHRGWFPAPAPEPPPPAAPQAAPPPPAGFRPCADVPLDAPAFLQAGPADAAGTFPLAWTPVPGAAFTLEEALRPGFEDAFVLYAGPDDHYEARGRAPGTYYYRVQAAAGAGGSPWSQGVAVTVAPPARWILAPAQPASSSALLAIQRALLRMCAARGDLLAVLSLLEGQGPDEAVDHVALLRSPPTGDPGVQGLSFGEQHDLSYGALHHPWLVGFEPSAPSDLRREPPDGAVCGVFAQRALDRGAWVAPANAPLAGVVDLEPAIPADRWLDLQDAQVNLVRQEPRGFLSLAADTLALEPDFVPVPARRLLALLRRAALKLGPTYVFEPNDDALRRMVQRGFEDLLGDLFSRGAFAGQDAEGAFQVVAGSPEVKDAAERGLFFVELRVAPSLPMRFVTVRLVQGGEGAQIAEVA